jgi:hypothetical protein
VSARQYGGTTCALEAWRNNAPDGVGDGTFNRVVLASRVCSWARIAAGDIDGDSDTDLVVAGWLSSSAVSLFVRDELGTYAESSIDVGASIRDIALADVSGDGKLDIVLATGAAVRTLLRSGSSFVAGPAVSVTCGGTGCASILATGDIDGDGHVDVVTAETQGASEGHAVTAIFGALGFSGTTTQTLGVGPKHDHHVRLSLEDVNGDGVLDTVLDTGVPPYSLKHAVFLTPARDGRGQRAAATPVVVDTGRSVIDAVLSDIDGDGLTDLVTGDFAGGTIGTFAFMPTHTRARSLAVKTGSTVAPFGFSPTPLREGTLFEARPRAVLRRASGATDEALSGTPVVSGDFVDVLRHYGKLDAPHRPLTNAWVVAGDLALRRTNDPERFAVVPRYGETLSSTALSYDQSGLTLASRASERGIVLQLPFIPGASSAGTVRVFAAIKRYKRASDFPADPLFATTDAPRLLPTIAGRAVVMSQLSIVEIQANDDVSLGLGTVVGKRFVIDAANKRVLVLTDELGVFQAIVPLTP